MNGQVPATVCKRTAGEGSSDERESSDAGESSNARESRGLTYREGRGI